MRPLCSQEPEGEAEACAHEASEQLSLSGTERGAGHDLAWAVQLVPFLFTVSQAEE